jgi:hypothetical protein
MPLQKKRGLANRRCTMEIKEDGKNVQGKASYGGVSFQLSWNRNFRLHIVAIHEINGMY